MRFKNEVSEMWVWVGVFFIISILVMTWCFCRAASKEDQYIDKLENEELDKNNKR